MRTGYAVVSDPAVSRPVERDTVTCSHCCRVVFLHDAAGRALHGVAVHCHQCDSKICVPCAERARCSPFEKKLDEIERRARLLSALGVAVLVAISACTATETTTLASNNSVDHESAFWRTQAALLDPDAYFLVHDTGHTLDVTVPADRTWYASNTFHLRFNEPTILGEDGYPGYYKSGFLRPLDSRRVIALPPGTRVRSNIQQNGAYLWYADPAAVWDTDARYAIDPRGLYYERLQRLATLPIREVIIEVRPWGETGTQLEQPLPTDFGAAMLVGASVFDATWLNVGILNVMNEVNNVHTVRFAESLLAPFRRDRIGDPVVRLKAGNYAGHLAPDPNDPEGWDKGGTGNILYVPLPADW